MHGGAAPAHRGPVAGLKTAKPLALPTSGVRQAQDLQRRDMLVFERNGSWDTPSRKPHIDFRESM